jgi:hypothetical protein
MQKISVLKDKLPKFNSSDILPLAFLILASGQAVFAFTLIWLGVSFSKLADQPPSTLVQQVDGRAFTVRAEDHWYREPEVIRKTVSDWSMLTFSWGKAPGKQGTAQDEGVEVKDDRVPTSAWEASFLLTPDYRDAFLEKLAADVVPADVFTGKVSGVLVIQTISPPQALGAGRWRVDMVATRILFDVANPSGISIPFNRTFYLTAIDPPRNPLKEDATEYQRVVYQTLAAGLQIEEIRPLEQEGLTHEQ